MPIPHEFIVRLHERWSDWRARRRDLTPDQIAAWMRESWSLLPAYTVTCHADPVKAENTCDGRRRRTWPDTGDGSLRPVRLRRRHDAGRWSRPRDLIEVAGVRAVGALIAPLGAFDRMSVGFPGVVRDGVVRTAPNFAPGNRHTGNNWCCAETTGRGWWVRH